MSVKKEKVWVQAGSRWVRSRWVKMMDSNNTPYYYNPDDETTQWEKPEEYNPDQEQDVDTDEGAASAASDLVLEDQEKGNEEEEEEEKEEVLVDRGPFLQYCDEDGFLFDLQKIGLFERKIEGEAVDGLFCESVDAKLSVSFIFLQSLIN